MLDKIAKKLFQPQAPESVDDLLARGARLEFRFPARDAQGRVMSAEEVTEMHLNNARRQIADHEKTIAQAAGLRSLAKVEAQRDLRRAKVSEANKHWELMIRRFRGGVVEMPAVEDAHRAFNAAQRAREPVEAEYSKVKAAEGARVEIERLRAEYKI